MSEAATGLVLAFDTATNHCSIALTAGGPVDGTVVAAVDVASSITHSRRLLESIDWLLDQAGARVADLAAIAVGLGPGSFTGLRIGVATAKGLCHGSGKPLIGVSTLDAVGCGVDSERLVCALFDARKHEVYSRLYRHSEDGSMAACSALAVGPAERVCEGIDEPVLLVGDGVAAHDAVWDELLGDRAERAPVRLWHPRAEMIGLLAGIELRNGTYLDPAGVVPLYVRSSDAELSLVVPAKGISSLRGRQEKRS